MRDAEHGQLLFVWEVCADADKVVINRGDTAFMKYFGQEQRYMIDHSCHRINMYTLLNALSEDEILGLPGQMTLDKGVEGDGKSLAPELYKYQPNFIPFGDDRNPIYKPLDRFADEIRLLMILPHGGNALSPLSCRLRHVPIMGSHMYWALSYTWGDSTEKQSLVIDGQPMEVRKNLYLLLLQLRAEHAIRPIWVDAICVNQLDLTERSRQVRRMTTIFRQASAVQIWLGSAYQNSHLALEKIQKMYDARLKDVIDGRTEARDYVSLEDEDIPAWEAIYQLMSRSWFSRTWVVQEVAHTPTSQVSHGAVLCGASRSSWSALVMISKILASRWNHIILRLPGQQRDKLNFDVPDPEVHFGKAYFLQRLREARSTGDKVDLLPLMISYRNTNSSDPRDKIYGLWGLADDARILISQPDYATPVRQIYASFVETYVQKYRRLDIICAAQPHLPGGVPGLPNWIPDWSSRSRYASLLFSEQNNPFLRLGDDEGCHWRDQPMFSAAGATRSIVKFFRDPDSDIVNEFAALGLTCDIVERISDHEHKIPANPQAQWKTMLAEDFTQSANRRRYLDSADAFRRTVVVDRTPTGQAAPPDVSFLDNAWHETDPDIDIERGRKWRYHTSNVLKLRHFIITQKGYIGLSQCSVLKGDKICVLFGCSVPIVLRKINNRHYFVGDCYVHGWMNGEMIETVQDNAAELDRLYESGELDLDSLASDKEENPSGISVESPLRPQIFRIR